MSDTIPTKIKEVVVYPDGRIDTCNAATYTGLSEKTLAMMRCNGNGPVPAPIVWTRFCNSGRLSHGMSLTDFKG